MLEAFLIALNISDQDLYDKVDIYSQVNSQMVQTEVEYDIALIGPANFNVREHSTYPVFTIWKTNTIDNAHFQPPKKAHIILTHTITKQHVIIDLGMNTGKLPKPGKNKDLVYPPGYDKNRKSYRYGNMWRDISLKEVSWIDGEYSLQIICGKMVSNLIKLSVAGTSIKPEDVFSKSSAIIQPDSQLCNRISEENKVFYPEAPKDLNQIVVLNGKRSDSIDENYTIYGVFSINKLHELPFDVYPMSVIIQLPDENGFIYENIFLSREYIMLKDNVSKGHFSYNIQKCFYNHHTHQYKYPENIIVSVIIGDVISNTVEITTLSQK